MSAVASAIATPAPASRRAWILSPAQDALFVVAAPSLVLVAAIASFAVLGPADATAHILLLHVVFTVAHHLPTFIRVYGDTDLFRRFKWTFVLAPVFPLGFAAAALAYLNARDYPVENVLYLWVLLALWDPWHFLMQHYGFTRIYDRHNAAPKKLAARMEREEIAAGKPVVREGETGDRFYVILSGLFAVTQGSLGLRRMLKPGDVFGERVDSFGRECQRRSLIKRRYSFRHDS